MVLRQLRTGQLRTKKSISMSKLYYLQMTHPSTLIQFILIYLSISAVISVNGTSSGAESSSNKNSEEDGRILAEQIQTKITKKLSLLSKEKIFHINKDFHDLHESLKDLNLGLEKSKRKLKPVKEEYEKVMANIDEICTILSIWSSGSGQQKEELDYLFHIAKKMKDLENQLIPLANLTNGLYASHSSAKRIEATNPMPKAIPVCDQLTASMNKVYEGSLMLIKTMRVEPWFLVPANDFTKIGEIIEQDKKSLSTAIKRLVDNLPELYAIGIPKIIKGIRAQLQADFDREYYAFVINDITNRKISAVQLLVDQVTNGSWDGVLRKVKLEHFTPSGTHYADEVRIEAFALEKFGIVAGNLNNAVDKVLVNISESLKGNDVVEKYASLRLLDLLNIATRKLYNQMNYVVECQAVTPGLSNNVHSLKIMAKELVEKTLQDFAVKEAVTFESIQKEIQEGNIDLSKPATFPTTSDHDLKQRVVLSAMYSMALFKRLDSLYQTIYSPINPANYIQESERVRKVMETEGQPLLIETKVYENYEQLIKNDNLHKYKILVKLEKHQKEFKQKLEKILKNANNSEELKKDANLVKCNEILSQIGNLKPLIWKWIRGESIQQSHKNSIGDVELENLYLIGAEMEKLKKDPMKLHFLKKEADDYQNMFGEPTSVADPKSASGILNPLSALYTLHQRTNQLMDQLSLEIWLLQPAEDFAQLPAEAKQDKAKVHEMIENLITTVDQNVNISTKLIPYLLERDKSKITELLVTAQSKLTSGPLVEREQLLKMLNQLSHGNYKSLSEVNVNSVSSHQKYIIEPLSHYMDNMYWKIANNVKQADNNIYTTLRQHQRLCNVSQQIQQHIMAVIHFPPGSPELEAHIQELRFMAINWVENLFKKLPSNAEFRALLGVAADRRSMPMSIWLEQVSEQRDILQRIVLRAMHLLFLVNRRFKFLFANHYWRNPKLPEQVKNLVNKDLVPENIGEMLYQRIGGEDAQKTTESQSQLHELGDSSKDVVNENPFFTL